MQNSLVSPLTQRGDAQCEKVEKGGGVRGMREVKHDVGGGGVGGVIDDKKIQ